MKKSFYTLILIAILLQSCLPESPKGYLGWGYIIGFAEKNSNNSSVITDDPYKYKVIMRNINFPDSLVGRRIYLEGDLYTSSGGYDYALEAVGYILATIKEIQTAENQGIIDLANNANVSLDNNRVWQTGKYLNLTLSYTGTDPKKHSFDFFINGETEKFENNRVTINICHLNNGDDVATKGYQTLLSMDLTSLFEKFTDKFDVKFVYTEYSQKKEVIISNIEKY